MLWSKTYADCEAALRYPNAGHIAIANPEIAPYGAAAREYLQSLNLWDVVRERLVYGENVMQATQFVATGNATVGLIAGALVEQGKLPEARCTSAIPEDTYTPIRQDAVLLARAGQVDAAQRFFAYLRSESARKIIAANGYGIRL